MPEGPTAAAASGVSAVLRRLPLFSQIEPGLVEVIAEATRSVTLPRRVVLFHQGQQPQGFFVVVTGLVKLAVLTAAGGQKVVEVIAAGESFGEAVMFVQRPYPVTATALEPSRLLAVPQEVVLTLLDSQPVFARAMLAGMAVRLHALVHDVGQNALRSGTQRVASFLIEHAQGQNAIVLGAGKQVIASRLNLTPETFSRILRELADTGVIRVQGRRLLIQDPAALAAHAH
jgi:CRP-like cAMP-binding protein